MQCNAMLYITSTLIRITLRLKVEGLIAEGADVDWADKQDKRLFGMSSFQVGTRYLD